MSLNILTEFLPFFLPEKKKEIRSVERGMSTSFEEEERKVEGHVTCCGPGVELGDLVSTTWVFFLDEKKQRHWKTVGTLNNGLLWIIVCVVSKWVNALDFRLHFARSMANEICHTLNPRLRLSQHKPTFCVHSIFMVRSLQ